MRPGRGRTLLQTAVIVAAVACAYSLSLGNDFVYDDRYVITENEVVSSPGNLSKAFRVQFYTGLDYYRPITLLSFAAEYRLWKANPLGYHITSLVLLLGVALSLYALLLRFLAGRRWAACTIALCFALHPAVSSVGMALGARGDLLCMLFLLCAYLAFLRRTTAGYAAAATLFALALLSKETAVTFPLVVLIMDVLLPAGLREKESVRAPGGGAGKTERQVESSAGRTARRAAVLAKRHVAFWCVLAAYLALRAAVLPGTTSGLALDPAAVLRSYAYLLQSSTIPRAELAYEPMFRDWFSLWRVILAAGIVCASCLAYVASPAGVRRTGAFWGAWAVLTFLPTANIVRQETIFDERYVVLPLAGIVAGIGTIMLEIGARRASWRRLKVGLAVALIVAFGSMTASRAKAWSDDVSFFTQWRKTSPENPRPRHHLGLVFWKSGKTALAEELFSQALELDPQYVPSLNMLGLTSYMKGDLDAARRYLERAVSLDPNFAAARFNLANVYYAQGDPDAALPHYAAAAELDPEWTEAVIGTARCYHELRKWEDALLSYRRALKLDPQAAQAYFGLSKLYEDVGKLSQAIGLQRRGLEYAPEDTAAIARLGRLLSEETRRRLREARGEGP